MKVYNDVNKEFENGMEINKNLLFRILEDNKDTEYGKKYGFSEIHDIEEYQKRVPVITYDDIEADIMRMSDGEKKILTAYPFDHMNLTSGTVGVKKRVPMTQPQYQVYVKYNKMYSDGLLAALLGDAWMTGRVFTTAEGTHQKLPSGITVGSASSKMADFIAGGKDALGQMLNILYTSPVEAAIPEEGTDTKYLHARFALADGNISGIVTAFFSSVVSCLNYIADHYEMLIDDIEHGTINEDISLSEGARASLEARLVPMPERAAELRRYLKTVRISALSRKFGLNWFTFTEQVLTDFLYMIGSCRTDISDLTQGSEGFIPVSPHRKDSGRCRPDWIRRTA